MKTTFTKVLERKPTTQNNISIIIEFNSDSLKTSIEPSGVRFKNFVCQITRFRSNEFIYFDYRISDTIEQAHTT